MAEKEKDVRRRRGQAMTEVVLLFPLFMFFLFAFAKIFALLILMQKLEIASFYAARRWQLESHRNEIHVNAFDSGPLLSDINGKVKGYLGYGSGAAQFLDLTDGCAEKPPCPGKPGVDVVRTQVWNVVTVTACTKPFKMVFYESPGYVVCSVKYVPNRDRPIAFVLPGVAP